MTVYKYTIFPAITYASEACISSISKRTKIKLQQIQRSFLIIMTKVYRTVSHETLSNCRNTAYRSSHDLYKDIRAFSRGQRTYAVTTELKKTEIPNKTRGIHSKDNHTRVDLSETEGKQTWPSIRLAPKQKNTSG
jgi:hypothetical protein